MVGVYPTEEDANYGTVVNLVQRGGSNTINIGGHPMSEIAFVGSASDEEFEEYIQQKEAEEAGIEDAEIIEEG